MAETKWPNAPVIYQIYPRSFLDTTGNGVGDLRGVRDRLAWVADLGADAVWLSPFFVSPLIDGGYDIADHCAVDSLFGTLDDFDAVVSKAHHLGLRVMIDMVLNHTSNQHAWFQDAIRGDDSAADRYLWRDPKQDGTPPNNWLSQFGLPGWTYNHKRRQYFFHQFLPCQPSLNLRNADVQASHKKCLRFWRERGVDGFRFDAVTSYLHDPNFRDNPVASREVREKVSGADFIPYTYQDHVHDMLPGDGAAYAEKLRDWAGEDAYLIGESTSGNRSFKLAMDFTQPGRLDGCYTIDMPEKSASPTVIAAYLKQTEPLRCPKWLSSHDQVRHLTRAADPKSVEDAVKAAQFFTLLMAFLPGAWLLYQGEELGLTQPELSKGETTDPFDLLYWPDGPGREGPRVPMPWASGKKNFGFSDGDPWLPMRWAAHQVPGHQVADDLRAFYQRCIALRREHQWGVGSAEVLSADETSLNIAVRIGEQHFQGAFVYTGGTLSVPEGETVCQSSEVTNNRLADFQAVITRR